MDVSIVWQQGKTETSGIVVGNYIGSTCHSFQFHIYSGSAPMIKFQNKEVNGVSSAKTYTFSKINVANGEWTHVAIVADTSAKLLSCYINGVLAETQSFTMVPKLSPMPLVIGGDNRSGNTGFFEGHLRSVTLYSDVRTAAEIKADMNAVDVTDANIIAHYDLTNETFGEAITDKACDYDMLYNKMWYEPSEVEAVTDYAYSMAIIGDQQVISINYPEKLHYIYDWILSNKDAKNIKYVMALGDITNERDKVSEWTLVGQQFERLSGILPMAIARGNHDYSEPFNKYIGFDGYTNDVVGRYDPNKLDDMYKLAKIGNGVHFTC